MTNEKDEYILLWNLQNADLTWIDITTIDGTLCHGVGNK